MNSDGFIQIDDFCFRIFRIPVFGEFSFVYSAQWHRALKIVALIVSLGVPSVVEIAIGRDQLILVALLALSLLLLTATAFSDPGVLPPAVGVEASSTQQRPSEFLRTPWYRQDIALCTFCRTCLHVRPRRSSHCRVCKVCVMEHDHHCAFLGCCIGSRNTRWFLAFLIVTCVAGVFADAVLLVQITAALRRGDMNVSTAAVPAVCAGFVGCVTVILAAFTFRVVYVILVGGSLRYGGTSQAVLQRRHQADVDGSTEFWTRMFRIIVPELPSLLPEYAVALAGPPTAVASEARQKFATIDASSLGYGDENAEDDISDFDLLRPGSLSVSYQDSRDLSRSTGPAINYS